MKSDLPDQPPADLVLQVIGIDTFFNLPLLKLKFIVKDCD
jgi:hypothetical protein